MSLTGPPALLLCALLLVPSLPLRADDKPSASPTPAPTPIAEFKARAGMMTATAISDDGRLVFTGEDDGLVTLWSVKTGGIVQKFPGHTSREVFAAALLPDGKRGVTCGDDNQLIVWDLATGKSLRQMSTGDAIPFVMSCTTDGALAATGCDDGEIAIWNLANGRRVTTLRRHSSLCSVLFSPDGRTLAAGDSDGQVALWDTAHWAQRHALPSADGASVGALAFSPDSRLLATGNQNGAGFVWNVAAGTQFSMFAGYAHPEVLPVPPVAPVFPGSTITPDNRSSILFLCFSLDAESIFGSIQDNPPRFWETKTGRFLGTGDWYEDTRFYIARYGFTFATAAITPGRDFIVTTKENLAQVWPVSFTPNSPPH